MFGIWPSAWRAPIGSPSVAGAIPCRALVVRSARLYRAAQQFVQAEPASRVGLTQALAGMSAYKDALHIKSDESGGRLALAQELLATGQGVVVLDGVVALRPSGRELLCEVISDGSGTGFASEVASARELLARSTLGLSASTRKLQWLVVDDYGTGTQELWRAS